MQAIPQKVQSLRFDWLFSPWQDSLFFFLPLPMAFLMLAGSQAFQLSNALLYAVITQEVIGLGAFHLGATWFHFLDKENQEHYSEDWKSGKRSLILGSILLFFGTILGQVFCAPLTFFLYICWSLNHLVQQNIGILLLYQNSKSEEARVPRNIQAWSQRLMALCFALLYFKRSVLAGTALADFMLAPIVICSLAGIAYCIAYFVSLGNQLATGKYVNLSGFAFWLVCIGSLIPFGFLGNDYDAAIMIPSVVHWCQYIGLNFIVAERKYQGDHANSLPVKRPIMLYVISGASLVMLVMTLKYFDQLNGQNHLPGQILRGAVLALSMVHYYQDGFIWRFREKFPREAMLPYLVRR